MSDRNYTHEIDYLEEGLRKAPAEEVFFNEVEKLLWDLLGPDASTLNIKDPTSPVKTAKQLLAAHLREALHEANKNQLSKLRGDLANAHRERAEQLKPTPHSLAFSQGQIAQGQLGMNAAFAGNGQRSS